MTFLEKMYDILLYVCDIESFRRLCTFVLTMHYSSVH